MLNIPILFYILRRSRNEFFFSQIRIHIYILFSFFFFATHAFAPRPLVRVGFSIAILYSVWLSKNRSLYFSYPKPKVLIHFGWPGSLPTTEFFLPFAFWLFYIYFFFFYATLSFFLCDSRRAVYFGSFFWVVRVSARRLERCVYNCSRLRSFPNHEATQQPHISLIRSVGPSGCRSGSSFGLSPLIHLASKAKRFRIYIYDLTAFGT